MRMALLPLALLGAAVFASAAPAALPAATRARLDAIAARALREGHVPGLALGIARDGQLVFARGYGFRDVAKKLPVNADTRFQIGSITKQFTAACILQLRAAGKLSLDDRLAKYVPDFPHAGEITLRQLLNQTTGLFNYTSAPRFEKQGTTTPGGLAAVEDLIQGKPLAFTPGTQWEYSNTNYYALGAVVAKASGMPYRDYLQHNIFDKVGMSQSGIMGQPLPDLALGYDWANGVFRPAPSFRPGWAGAAGFIVSTVGDMAKWDAALSAGKVISAAGYREATTAGRLADAQPDGYGYGWVVDTHAGQPRVWHNGGTAGFLAVNVRYPGDHLDIILLENATTLDPSKPAAEVFAALEPQQASAAARAESTPAAGEDPAITKLARQLLDGAMSGKMDRSRFTPQMDAALKPQVVQSLASQLGPAGPVKSFVFGGKQQAQGMTVYTYRVTLASAKLAEVVTLDAQGRVAGLLFRPAI